MDPALIFLDEDRNGVALGEDEAAMLFLLTSDLDAATVSSCPSCRSRVLAAVAFVEILNALSSVGSGSELLALSEDAPTLHIFLSDMGTNCDHRRWRDPGADEWFQVVGPLNGPNAGN